MLIEIMIATLLQANILLKVGIMLASAMLIGGLLVDSWKNLRIVMFSMLIFVVFQLWIHDTIVDNTKLVVVIDHPGLTTINIIASILLVIAWIFAMWLGMMIVKKARQPEALRQLELKSLLDELNARQSLVNFQERLSNKKEDTIPIRKNAPITEESSEPLDKQN